MTLPIQEPKVFSEVLRKMVTEDVVDASVLNPFFQTLINNDAYLKEAIERAVGLTIEELKDPNYDHGTLVSNAILLKNFISLLASTDGASSVGMEVPSGLTANPYVASILLALHDTLRGEGGASFIGARAIAGLDGVTVQEMLSALNTKASTPTHWNEIPGKPSEFPPSSHEHPKSEVGIATGTGTFPGGGNTKTIPHGLNAVPSFVEVVPTSNPQGRLGEVWISDLNSLTFTVGNTGSFKGSFRFMAVK